MLWIGTSGWQYGSWRETFYPRGLPQRSWLEHYAARFRVVEVNNTFYRLPRAETFADWDRRAPADFVYVLKLSRYLTHVKRLKEAEGAVRLFLERSAPMEAKRGPFLMQLPPTLRADLPRLDDALAALGGFRVAVEFRHATWFTDDVLDLLARHDAALCLADRRSRPVSPLERTAGWGYVRFHHGRGRPEPCYGEGALRSWVERVAGLWSPGDDVYAFFNNDPRGCAVRDAVRFAALAERAGLVPTRVPGRREIAVA